MALQSDVQALEPLASPVVHTRNTPVKLWMNVSNKSTRPAAGAAALKVQAEAEPAGIEGAVDRQLRGVLQLRQQCDVPPVRRRLASIPLQR